MSNSLNILIVDTYYPAFLKRLRTAQPELTRQPYAAQWRAIMDTSFGTADYYSVGLSRLGHTAQEIVANDRELQQQWARERAPALEQMPAASGALQRWQIAILTEQIHQIKPDVLYIQDMNTTGGWWLRQMRQHVGLIVGQTAYPLGRLTDFGAYDLLISSLPHYVERFRAKGLAAEYLRIGFSPRALERVGSHQRRYDTTFVGGISAAHSAGRQLLETVARQVQLDVWGYGVETLAPDSPLARRHRGEAWALDMYRILAQSRVTLNRHIEIAEHNANNMRLYEATGMGACLLTDTKRNLSELFKLDREIVAYSGPEDCAQKVAYLLAHEAERASIAAAGQARTLRDHTYDRRMEELAPLLEGAVRRTRRHWFGAASHPSVSVGHTPIERAQVTRALANGWQSEDIPDQQRALVERQLADLRRGKVASVFRVASAAVRATKLRDPLLLELGCASGYYQRALSMLLGYDIRYIGLDYSRALLQQGARYDPGIRLLAGDATAVPLRDGCCDIAFSSALLMHVPDYVAALRETVRLSREWIIFHRTPIVISHQTTYIRKEAYGVPVVELIFNERELLDQIQRCGLRLVKRLSIDRTRIASVGEPICGVTYICRKIS